MEVNGYTIIQAARNTGRELTQNQVNQILRWREQMVQAQERYTDDREKNRQMDADWRWWYNE
jgi:hypothetical protein